MPAPVPYDQRTGSLSQAAPAPAPPDAGWMEGIAASFRSSVYDQPGYMEGQRRQAYQDLLEAIAPYAATPLAQAQGRKGVIAGSELQDVYAALNSGQTDQAYNQIWTLAGKVRAADPKALQGVAPSREAFDKGWESAMQARQQRDFATVQRTRTAPWLIGSLGGGMVDPINIMTMPFGGGEAGLALRMAREAALNVGVEAIEQPMINRERRAQGRPELTAKERAAGIAFAAAGGAAIPAGMAGIGRGMAAGSNAVRSAFERTVTANWDRLPQGLRERWTSGVALDDSDLADLAELHVGRPNMSEGEQAAVNVLEREGWAARSNPFAPNGAGAQLHDAALRGTMASLLNDIPVVPRPERPAFVAPAGGGALPGGDRGATAIGSGVVAGDAQSRFMAKVRQAESGGSDVAAATASSAFGRYQFTRGTWLHYYLDRFGRQGMSDAQILGKRADGAVQDRLMADMTADNAKRLQAIGAPVTEGNLYLMHFLGPADARRVLHAEPGTPLAGLISEAAIKANRSILEGKTAGDVVAWTDRKMGSAGSGERYARAEVDGGRIGDAELAARLQDEADRIQASLADAQRAAAEPVARDDGEADLPDLRAPEGADAQWRAQAVVEQAARANALQGALGAIDVGNAVAPPRAVASLGEARTLAQQEIVGRPLRNGELEATVSAANVKKMVNEQAKGNTTGARDQAQAIANLDHLFAAAHEYHAGPDVKAMARGEDPARSDIGTVRNFIAAMETPDGPVAVRMVVKETRAKGQANPLYTVQTVHVGEKPGARAASEDAIVAGEPQGASPARARPGADIGGPGVTDKAAQDLADGARLGDLDEAERTAFRDPAGEAAKAQAQSLLHDARAMIGPDGLDDPELARLIDDIDEDHSVIDTLRSCML